MPDRYDLVPYTEHSYAESSPDNLGVIARLAGFPMGRANEPPRVLEVGCGRGGNLLPLACAWPDATFVGVDRSAVQIRDAERVAHGCSLGNVRFVTADFTEDLLPEGPFDVVLCHGVYSWISPSARHALLTCVRRALAPEGIAYVSFNTLPGWYASLAARDWMRFAARASLAGGPRDALGWLAGVVSPEAHAYREGLLTVQRRLQTTDAVYVTHEYLSEEHHPVYVTTFLDEAGDSGLSYLADAVPLETAFELLPDTVRAAADTLDVARKLALFDFTRGTAFRRALLVRSDTAPARRVGGCGAFEANRVTECRVASRLVAAPKQGSAPSESWEGAGVTAQVSPELDRALRLLAGIAPRSIAFADLAREAGIPSAALATELFDLWLAAPGIDLHLREPLMATAVSSRPRALAVARWHAREGGPITNGWHQEVDVREPVARFILGLLDGERTLPDLGRAVHAHADGRVSHEEATALVRASLTLFANAALLVG